LQLLSTSRFLLRKQLLGGGGSHAQLGATEELPACTAAGDEVFLFHLGYRAPGPYQLFVATAPQACVGKKRGLWAHTSACCMRGCPLLLGALRSQRDSPQTCLPAAPAAARRPATASSRRRCGPAW
jgi:hypothetical protein